MASLFAATRPSYPSQSGIEIQPSSRYVLCGLDGMFDGRFPALLHASHSFTLFSLSFRTIALAAAKESMLPRTPSYPSQSGYEIQPSSRYVRCGVPGMLEGRFPALHQPLHSFWLFSSSFRTIALAAAKGTMSLCCVIPVYPSQFGYEIQPLSRYVLSGLDGMFDGRFPALLQTSHSFSLFSLSFRTIALAAAKGSMSSRFATTRPSYPSQSGIEIQPSSQYVLCGQDGMFEGRSPALRHACHSFTPFSLSFRTITLAAANGSMSLANNTTHGVPSKLRVEMQHSLNRK